MRNTVILWGLAALATLSMTACNKDQAPRKEREIGFTASVVNMTDIAADTKTLTAGNSPIELIVAESSYPETTATKAIRNTTVSNIGNIWVACVNTGTQNFNFRQATYNLPGKKWIGNAYYFHGNPHETLKFYAWYDIQGTGGDNPYSTHYKTDGTVELKYTVPTTLSQQRDFIAANATASGNSSENVALEFHHLMAGINFVDNIKTNGGQIHSISFVGVNAQGTCNLDGTAWANQSTATTYTFEKADGSSYTTPADTIDLLLMPQSFAAGSAAYIEIIYRLKTDGLLESARFPLAGTTWASGKVVTYTISITK